MTVAAIIAIIQADKVLKRLREKILSNRGTFRDTFEYSNRAAELLGANFSESVLAMSLDDRVSACVELLRDRYDDIMPLLDAVQKRADLKNKLAIAPKHPPFNAERAEQIGTSLRDLSVSDERIQRRARSAPATATRAIHDDYIEANVELRSSAGIKCYISRVTDGNCCDWCTRVAGRYEYGTEPEGIFHRHDNCGCSVTYENGRERQDVWSKKTWTVPEDAGAPEPVRFTQEQAAAAGAEPPRVFSVGEARELNDVKVKENTAKPEDVYNSSIDNPSGNGIIKSGAVSGGLIPDSEEAQAHAERYYESVRKMETDIENISKNTGFSEEDISQIKNHVFISEHDLGGDVPERFYPNYAMSQSWQRLIDGKNIQKHDITLLNHEKMESELMKQGYSQKEAHELTEKVYNYAKESREYYAEINKHRKK